MTGEDGLTRGEFGLTGAGAGVALATSARRHRKKRQRRRHQPASLRSVEHIVILTQENRSFDSYFGTLAGVKGFSDPNALKLANGRSVFHQPYALSLTGELPPWRLDSHRSSPCAIPVDNGWDQMHNAWAAGRMDRWTRATGPWAMSCYTRTDIPWHMALADEFTVCDACHCSVLGPTNPNRHMMWTGTIDPQGRGGGPAIDNSGRSYSWKTYPERLTAARVSWRIYHEADDFDDNTLKYFTQYQRRVLAVDARWLRVLGDVRPHVADPDDRTAVRRPRAADQRLAPRDVRRHVVVLRLLEARIRLPDAPRHLRGRGPGRPPLPLRPAGSAAGRPCLPPPAGAGHEAPARVTA